MALLSLVDAKLQLNVEDSFDDVLISGLIDVAQGIVEQELGQSIYQSTNQVPTNEINAIVLDELPISKQAALKMAIKLTISTLYLYRESSLDVSLSDNPAFKACLKGFNQVFIG